MYTCESPTQAYIFIYSTFGRSLADLERLKFLGYDRACDHPFLKNLDKKGSVGAKILLENIKFMVDIWHCEKHKEPTCMPPDNPKCVYHHCFLMFMRPIQNMLNKHLSGWVSSNSWLGK